MLRRFALTGLLSVGSLLLFAGGASADKPVREPFPAQEDTTYAAGELCDFPVSIETLQNNEIVTTFSDGRQRLTGALKVRLTNVDTGESLIVNASGAGWATQTDTALEVSGQGLWLLLQDSGDEPGPGIFLYRGNIEWQFEFASERLTVLSATGSVRNLCGAELAADRQADAAGDDAATPPSPTPTPTPSPTPSPTPDPTPTSCLASNNCYPKPVNSGAGATGVPAGQPAPTNTNCTTAPASGQVLTGCLFTDAVVITTTGAGATYRYSEFRGGTGQNAMVNHRGSGTLTVEDSDFGPTSGCNNADNGFTGSNSTLRRVRFNSHVHEGPRNSGNNILVEDSFIGPLCSNPGDHADGFQGYQGGTNVVVRHNTVDMRSAAYVNAALFWADNSPTGVAVDNLLMGGGYTLRQYNDVPGSGPWVERGNRFVNGAWLFGPVDNKNITYTAATCSDNRLVTIDASYNITSIGNVVNCDGSIS